MTLPVPEKGTNSPVLVRSSIDIDCIVFDKSFCNLNWKKQFDELNQARRHHFADVVLNQWLKARVLLYHQHTGTQ